MLKKILSLGFFIVTLLTANASFATDYYVDPSGSDANDGTSTATAWQTLAKVSATTFQPGDKILFKTGGVWNGQLIPKGSGVLGNPIIVDMYGSGSKPLINGNGTVTSGTAASGAVELNDVSYWEVNNIEVSNYGSTPTGTPGRAGILANSLPSGGQRHIFIRNCYVHDVNSDSTTSANKITGGIILVGQYDSLVVDSCHVKNVCKEGIRTSINAYRSSNIVFTRNLVENVWGDGMVITNSSSGSRAAYNRLINVARTKSGNYAGLWLISSKNSVVEYNEVSDITGGFVYDGEAFDDDTDCSGDIFQYNYSHNNAGGFMLVMPSSSSLIFRFNISQNDGWGSNQEIFHLTKNTNGNLFYNNTIYIGSGITTRIFNDLGTNTSGKIINFHNNIIYCAGTISYFDDDGFSSSSSFQNNCFYPSAKFTAATNYSTTQTNLITANPLFVAGGTGGNGLGSTTGYQLQSGSPCLNTGFVLNGNGGRDFAGTDISSDIYATVGALWSTQQTVWNINTIPVKNDTYTYDASASKGTNFGTSTSLVAKFGRGYATETGTNNIGYNRRTYVRFPTDVIKNSNNIGKILLRVRYYAKDALYTTNGLTVSRLYNAEDTWTETGLTWNNQPAWARLDSITSILGDNRAKPTPPNPITDSYINSNSFYYYLDVTDKVLSLKNGDSLPANISFVLQGYASVDDGSKGNTGYTFFSREFTNTNGQAVDSLAPALLVYASESTTPVNASPLSAIKDGKSVKLSWTTYSEVNASTFIIERSGNGKNFVAIGNVNALGNSNQAHNYIYTDNAPLSGIIYYRWKEIDLDGKIQYSSNIASINLGTTLAIQTKIYPNPIPAGHTLLIAVTDTKEEIVQIQLVDLAGKIVSTKTLSAAAGTQITSIMTSGLVKGIYFVRLLNKSGIQITDTEKVVVK